MHVKTVQAFIVDDDSDICWMLSELLKTKNIKSSYANSLHEARVMLDNLEPDIVFLDNRLPDGSGIEFSEYIAHKFPQAKIVLITALEQMSANKPTNIAAYVHKPFTLAVFKEIIDKLV